MTGRKLLAGAVVSAALALQPLTAASATVKPGGGGTEGKGGTPTTDKAGTPSTEKGGTTTTTRCQNTATGEIVVVVGPVCPDGFVRVDI